jgi:hypothetical protein
VRQTGRMSSVARAVHRITTFLLTAGARVAGARMVGLLVLLLAAGVVVRRGLDDALSAMHLPGAVAASASGLSGVETMLDPGRMQAAFESWQAWSLAPGSGGYLPPSTLLAGYAAIDVLLVGLPLALLLLAGLHSARSRALGRSHPLRDATVTAATYATLPVVVFLLAGAAGNGMLLLAAASGAATWQLVLVGGAALVKWLVLGLAVLAFVLGRLAHGLAEGAMTAAHLAHRSNLAVLAPVIILRAQVLTVGVLAGLLLLLHGDLGRQVQDVLLGLPERPAHQVLALAGAMVLAGLTYSTGRWCEAAYRRPPRAPGPGEALPPRVLWLSGLAGAVVVGAGAVLLSGGRSAGWALLPPGAVLLVLAGLSAFPGVRRAWSGTTGVPPSPATTTWLRALVALPLAATGLVALQGVVSLGVAREYAFAANLLALAALFIALAAVPLLWRGLWERGPGRWWGRDLAARRAPAVGAVVVSLAGVLAVVGVAVWGAADPWAVGARLGSLGIIFAAFGLLLVVLSALVWAGDRVPARGVLAFLGVRRVPLVSMVVLCLFATSYLDTSWRYHDVRLLPDSAESAASAGSAGSAGSANRAMSVAEAFDAWVTRHRPAEIAGEKVRVPMLFVATGGGGIRAYYWTATVLDCLFVDGQCEHTLPAGSASSVFAASGISGGSVGLAAFRATGDGADPARLVLHDGDFIAPVLAGLAFRDVPNAVLRADPRWLDRAGVLEVAWERSAAERGHDLAEGFARSSFTEAGDPRFPLLLFNGAAVEDGCRVTVSVLETAPAEVAGDGAGTARSCDSLAPFAEPGAPTPVLARTRDAFDYTCDGSQADAAAGAQDLRLSSAALLSARFPYVSPSGGLTSCTDPDRRTFVLDGGIIESSGAGPLVELWASLAPLVRQVNQEPDSGVCVDPRLVLIDNGYADTRLAGLPRRPPELLAPVRANAEAAGRAAAAARQAAAITFQATLGEAAACRHPDGTTSPTGADVAADAGAVAQLYPRSHPGPLAPLGWSLSGWAQADLRRQLDVNDAELDRVRSWFARPPDIRP